MATVIANVWYMTHSSYQWPFFYECAPMLEKMNDFSQTACPGIKNYSLYKGSIGYDIKRVKLCNWPTNTVRDVDCCLWYEKDEMKKCNLCEKCMILKWQLDKSCKRHNATSPATKRKRQEASSKYPFVYLSPASQKMKTKNLQKAVASTRRAVTDVIERMPINDIQNDEIADLVHSVNSSKEGQNELENFAEADKSGEGRGELTKQIWEADVDDVQKFLLDQRKNGMSVYSSSCHLRIQFFTILAESQIAGHLSPSGYRYA